MVDLQREAMVQRGHQTTERRARRAPMAPQMQTHRLALLDSPRPRPGPACCTKRLAGTIPAFLARMGSAFTMARFVSPPIPARSICLLERTRSVRSLPKGRARTLVPLASQNAHAFTTWSSVAIEAVRNLKLVVVARLGLPAILPKACRLLVCS